MCGVAGEVTFDGERADTDVVRRMAATMRDRGPDGEGSWSCGWAALGHRRLSVIDLSDAGGQPMQSADARVTIVFNGCVYNHRELRHELEPGRPFGTTSDTEVVLAAYERWGARFVDHLVGMFAVVVVDERRREVVLARDRLGVKPLYLATVGGRLRFASTLPALLAGGGVDTELDPVGLHHYLSWHSIVPGSRTVLRGVRKLPPATVRVIDERGGTQDREYWAPTYERDAGRACWTARDWEDAVEDALRTAVRRRLVADVPVGVLLSGGLDSSLLVALLAEESADPVGTYSIGFEDAAGESGDEFRWSDVVAERFGTEHTRILVPTTDLPTAVDEAVDAMTEPMATQDVAAFFLLSRAVSEDRKVVQSGQGADEVFAGYRYHRRAGRVSRDGALDAFAGAFSESASGVRALVEPGRLPAGDVSRDTIAAHLAAPGAETALDAVLRLDTHLLMPDDPVKRVDSMTMASGLEARVPFLDQDLVTLAAACPPALKIADDGKGLLKALGRRLLPQEVVDRPKGYFPVPALRHLDGALAGVARDALLAPEARQRGLLRQDVVQAVIDRPDAFRTRVGGALCWQLAVLELWLQRHGIR
ncbi:N-acetylglutaminylglutamine amidotransferase [Curtobacterium sp. MCBD17_034]|uniref:N-acetylglutaminylglutamine amidotransferase n=1 Tax=unclassified Curtobacterium TaxID=257496 RepID=UPI000DA6E2BD|nr:MULTISPECIES: N-acetylglutaminylglutamine amidotransferase [unclassified Curtobacterium]PZE75868.1 N-acetylglutaminylglutamine amidotransferase [Curtobacterium sp. MCBD17_019]PZF60822.1 N-acetylglutaminylglutamine amidotransferase [Curtobacterium sp. MCBD17_034]PZM40171.1 N-acetylglutaminylglutamine amidotransferase [Curtobacterium sp. MCBD17_031]